MRQGARRFRYPPSLSHTPLFITSHTHSTSPFPFLQEAQAELLSLEAEGKPATAVRQSRISNTISVLAAASSGGFGNSPRASMAAPAPPPPVVHQTSDAREESALSDLIAMGFARGAALTALRQANGNVSVAVDSLFQGA